MELITLQQYERFNLKISLHDVYVAVELVSS